MKPTVYIETTIAGHLTSRLPSDVIVVGQMLSTRNWWTTAGSRFELYTSELVMEEASRGDAQAAAERVAAINNLRLVPVSEAAIELAKLLISQNALPTKARVDAAHIAVAATNSIRYLLTWNCKHLANASLRLRIEETCRQMGYNPPIICTPPELPEEPL